MMPRIAWRLSPQLYAWRLRGESYLVRGCDDAAAAGYTGVEVDLSALAAHGALLGDRLRERSLSLAAAFVSLRDDASSTAFDDVASRVVAARALGCRVLNVALHPARGAPCINERAAALVLTSIAQRIGDVRVCWHPHEAEFRGNPTPLHEVLDASADAVAICLDVGWALRAAVDVPLLVARLGRRLGSLHVRDARDGRWVQAVGEGDLPLARIVRALDDAAFAGWLSVELWFERTTNVSRDLAANATRSRLALQRALTGSPAPQEEAACPSTRA